MESIRIGSTEYQPHQVVEQANKAAGWFSTIAIFSVINTGLHLFQSDVTFVIGLGASTVIDVAVRTALKEAAPPVSTILVALGLMVNIIVIGVFVLGWWLSKRGHTWAYVTGMVLYLLDGLLFVLVQDIVGIGFHLFFLFGLWGGYRYVRARRQAEWMLAQPVAVPLATPTEAYDQVGESTGRQMGP